jgi:hypothetical protein
MLERGEREKEIADLLLHLERAGVGTVDLVDETIGRLFPSIDFFRTKRVWGRGPSEASTSRSTPSTIVRIRSTSEPKSRCPGVSTMLMIVSR